MFQVDMNYLCIHCFILKNEHFKMIEKTSLYEMEGKILKKLRKRHYQLFFQNKAGTSNNVNKFNSLIVLKHRPLH